MPLILQVSGCPPNFHLDLNASGQPLGGSLGLPIVPQDADAPALGPLQPLTPGRSALKHDLEEALAAEAGTASHEAELTVRNVLQARVDLGVGGVAIDTDRDARADRQRVLVCHDAGLDVAEAVDPAHHRLLEVRDFGEGGGRDGNADLTRLRHPRQKLVAPELSGDHVLLLLLTQPEVRDCGRDVELLHLELVAQELLQQGEDLAIDGGVDRGLADGQFAEGRTVLPLLLGLAAPGSDVHEQDPTLAVEGIELIDDVDGSLGVVLHTDEGDVRAGEVGCEPGLLACARVRVAAVRDHHDGRMATEEPPPGDGEQPAE